MKTINKRLVGLEKLESDIRGQAYEKMTDEELNQFIAFLKSPPHDPMNTCWLRFVELCKEVRRGQNRCIDG